ncbi:MAG: hypothetical protein RR115_06125 [Hydrogenoanaerobacterium sp.]
MLSVDFILESSICDELLKAGLLDDELCDELLEAGLLDEELCDELLGKEVPAEPCFFIYSALSVFVALQKPSRYAFIEAVSSEEMLALSDCGKARYELSIFSTFARDAKISGAHEAETSMVRKVLSCDKTSCAEVVGAANTVTLHNIITKKATQDSTKAICFLLLQTVIILLASFLTLYVKNID